MLTVPPQGLYVFSNPPLSDDVAECPKTRQLLYITLNDQILSQIRACGGKGLSITFGSNAALKIGDQVHRFSGITPEVQSSPFEIYRKKNSSSKLEILGRVTHRIQVRRGLDSTSMEKIKNRTEEAERERHSRKAVLLEKPPPSKRTSSVHTRHNSSGSRAFLTILDNTSGGKGSGVRSLPSSPLLRPTTGSSTPKYLPVGGSPRIAPLSSPRLQPSSPKTTPPLRTRLIHMLALGAQTEQTLQDKLRAIRSELTTCLQDVARKVAPGRTSWELKDESYRDLRPKEWRNYTSKEREMVEKKQTDILARLPPPADPETKFSQSLEIPKKRSASDASETTRPFTTTPKPVDSPVQIKSSAPTSVPAKRPAEDDAVNPVRKVGGGIITAKKKSTKVGMKEVSSQKESAASKSIQSRTPPPKKTKENPKIKSAERVVNSDSDSDTPLEKQMKSTISRELLRKAESSSSGFKGSGMPAIESDPKQETYMISPTVSNTYRSRTSSTSSSNSYSPPKKRSPLATNVPITAARSRSPSGMSLPSNGKKRAREDEILSKQDKRQKLQIADKDAAKPQPTKDKHEDRQDSKQNKIGQEYHDLADRFRKLYPEYQQLHRRLQALDTDHLAKEKSNVDKLFRMQEQLEKWKATLWKAAGETRHTERANGMVGIRV